MPISISQYIGVEPDDFEKTGAFDAILDVDSRLFIDPHLLLASSAPELSQSYQKVTGRFKDVLLLLEKSKNENDVFWREAQRRFSFPELRGLCIGYSSKDTNGSGMGPSLRKRILKTAKEIIEAGTKDPEIFELVGLLEEDIGPDRISDMIGRIIVDDLFQYTNRIFSEFEMETTPIGNTLFKSITNPFNGHPIILLPRDILRDLPIAKSWEDVDILCAHNIEVRNRVNKIIGDTWKQATSEKKAKLRSVVLEEPEVLKDLIDSYRKKPAETYDFENDRAGQVIWFPASRQYAKEFPLELALSAEASPEELLRIVLIICNKFKDLTENNDLSSLLYDSSKGIVRAKKEEASQKLFYGIADAYCSANNLNIDISREPNAGRGPVDFKFSKGYHERILVEVKLTRNKNLLHGFETQIEEYKKAEKTQYGIYLVIDVLGGYPTRVKELKRQHRYYKDTMERVPELLFVNALPKASASKY